MRSFFCKTKLAAAMFAGIFAYAAATKPNTITPQESSAGWILLFDGDTNFGWAPRGDVKATVNNGELSLSGGQGFLATTTAFPNFNLKAEVWISADANSGIFLRCGDENIDADTAYEVNVNDMNTEFPTGSIVNLAKTRVPVRGADKWTAVEITAYGNRLIAKMDGKVTAEITDTKHKNGNLALQYDGAGTVKYRNVKLQPLNLESIFNGKDLSGWKEVPGHKSVYSVTPEGWMNVKDGNGDIQTEREWGNFTMQLEIISHGDHLNSGVFYRALSGQFWSGYEAQIRNEWISDVLLKDGTKVSGSFTDKGDTVTVLACAKAPDANNWRPTRESKTINKSEVAQVVHHRDQPVDIGTGGIYNRQPARKVVSSDREWFTMTIVAHGTHMATWVNGYQVSDFVDTKPPAESARNGSRVKPGVISLQGHDPTTNLSFRNIKVREMP